MSKINWRRWLPNNPALVAGSLTSAALVIFGRLGLHIPTDQVKPVLGAGISFLVAAIVHKKPTLEVATVDGKTEVTATVPTATAGDLADLAAEAFRKKLAADPALEDQIVKAAIALVTSPRTVLDAFARKTVPSSLETPAQPTVSVTTNPTPVVHLPQT